MSNSLATIEKISKIYSVEKANNIEMAVILDYHVMVIKDQFKEGDFVVFITTGAILPDGLSKELTEQLSVVKQQLKFFKKIKEPTQDDLAKIAELNEEEKNITSQNSRPEFEHLRSKDFTIKALHMKSLGIISEGIVYPLSILSGHCKYTEFTSGLDVTDCLGITKVSEDPIEEGLFDSREKSFLDRKLMKYALYRKLKSCFTGKEVTGGWLSIFPQVSDEENAQKVLSRIISKHGKDNYYISEKMEGQSCSFYNLKIPFLHFFNKNKFGCCSRKVHLKSFDGSVFWLNARRWNMEETLKNTKKSIFVRGEQCGGSIQGNIYGFTNYQFFVYDVYDMENKYLHNYEEMIKFCKETGLQTTPILNDDFTLPDDIQELLNLSDGYSVFGENVWREGIVIRHKYLPHVHFKVKSPKYKLIHGK